MNKTHGESRTPLFKVWTCMLQRCQNPRHKSFASYGERGITVCESWQRYVGFRDDMAATYAQGLQLDRINNDEGYGPANCRWVTPKQNNRNKRTNRLVEFEGRFVTIREASELSGINWVTLRGRLDRGITDPAQLYRKGREPNLMSNAKLTAEDVALIRHSAAPTAILAREFNVCVSTVQNVRTGRSWTAPGSDHSRFLSRGTRC